MDIPNEEEKEEASEDGRVDEHPNHIEDVVQSGTKGGMDERNHAILLRAERKGIQFKEVQEEGLEEMSAFRARFLSFVETGEWI